MMASGEPGTTLSTTLVMMAAFFASRSIRLIPGWRGNPAVITDDVAARGVARSRSCP